MTEAGAFVFTSPHTSRTLFSGDTDRRGAVMRYLVGGFGYNAGDRTRESQLAKRQGTMEGKVEGA